MTSDERTIHQRIADAYVDIAASGFDKSERVQGGYPYIPIAQMLAIVRAAHSKHGIITVFGPVQYDTEQGEKRITKQVTNKYGDVKTYQVANGHVDVRIYGAGGDWIETTVSCEAQDNSDKLTNLLLTNAQRALYRTLYAIDEGPGMDPEEFNFSVEEKNELTAEKMEEESRPRNGWGAQPPADDPFYSKETTPEQRQEQAVVEAMGDDAQFVDASAIAEAAKARREAVDVGNARAMLAQLRRSDPQNEILSAYISKYGGLSQLKDPQVIDCYLDLQDAGVVE